MQRCKQVYSGFLSFFFKRNFPYQTEVENIKQQQSHFTTIKTTQEITQTMG